MAFLALGACAPKKEQDPRSFVTQLKFGNNNFFYISNYFGIPESTPTTTFGWVGLGRSPVYKRNEEGLYTVCDRVYFAFNNLKDICSVYGPTETNEKFKYTQPQEHYLLKDRPFLQAVGKFSIFKLEDNFDVSRQNYINFGHPVLKDERMQVPGVWKLNEDGIFYPQKDLNIILGSMKGANIAYLYEEYPFSVGGI